MPQIVGTYAHVAVADDDYFVRGIADQTRQLRNLIVGRRAPRTVKDADAAVWKVGIEPSQNRLNDFVFGIDAENNFVLGIIQTAEAGEVFVSVRVESPKRFQDA